MEITASQEWKLAAVPIYCGYCHEIIPKADPVLEIRLNRVKKPRLRCEKCAGEPAPTIWPIENAITMALPFLQLSNDEREPGIEG